MSIFETKVEKEPATSVSVRVAQAPTDADYNHASMPGLKRTVDMEVANRDPRKRGCYSCY